ncbi:MAG: DUF2934 domain-containing protein [Nibricoccus sp.]
MKTHQSTPPPASFEQISRTAYELWQQAGSPQGRDLEFWLAAEQGLQRGKRSKLRSGDPTPLDERTIEDDLDDEITPTAGSSKRSATSL